MSGIGATRHKWGRQSMSVPPPPIQTSTCSATARASSTSMPRYWTVLSIFVCPSKSCTARRLPCAGRLGSPLSAVASGCRTGVGLGRCLQSTRKRARGIGRRNHCTARFARTSLSHAGALRLRRMESFALAFRIRLLGCGRDVRSPCRNPPRPPTCAHRKGDSRAEFSLSRDVVEVGSHPTRSRVRPLRAVPSGTRSW